MKPWQMHRAGLFNFWYYNDLETFDFADGKLLLRGSNGSGKSVTMQSLITVLLDGRTGSDRLDPFGSKARRMEDYLLGEKDLVERDERTGYLFLEYKRKGEEAYCTTAIGLRAKRGTPLQFWGFVVLDNRRIGVDFDLHRIEYLDGQRQTVPLTRRELEGRLGDGGHLVTGRREYAALVNRHIFGFTEPGGYTDLVKLLVQLRTPKLSKDFKPSVIYEILNDSLSALTDDELKPLSDTIESIDQTEQQCAQLEKERKGLLSLRAPYDRYNEFLLWEKADGLTRTLRQHDAKRKELAEREDRHAKDVQTKAEKETVLQDREREFRVLDEQEKALQDHDVLRAERDRRLTQKRQIEAIQARTAKHKRLEQKREHVARTERDLHQQQARARELEAAVAEHLLAMAEPAAIAAFADHQTRSSEFQVGRLDESLKTWRAEAESHRTLIRSVCDKWREDLRKRERSEEARDEMEDSLLALEKATEEAHQLEARLREAREALLLEIDVWLEESQAVLPLPTTAIRHIRNAVDGLYEETQWADVIAPLAEEHERAVRELVERQVALNHARERKQAEIDEAKRDLAEWQARKDPEPDRHPDTIAARADLQAHGVPFQTFYSAVEFRDQVDQAARERLESALTRMGILDALIVPRERAVDLALRHDRILDPSRVSASHEAAPNQRASSTLLTWFYATPESGNGVDAADIEAVLATLTVSESHIDAHADSPPAGHAFADLDATGAYRIGPIRGHAPREEAAIYIGREARRRFRERKIDELCRLLAALQAEHAELARNLAEIEDARRRVDEARAVFPTEQQVRAADEALQKQLREVAVRREEGERKSKLFETALAAWRAFHAALEAELNRLALARTEAAWRQAFEAMDRYLALFQKLELDDSQLGATHQRLVQVRDHLDELVEDRTQLEMEIAELDEEVREQGLRLEQIDKRLEEMGAEEIRAKIQALQERLRQLPEEIKSLNRTIARLGSEIDNSVREIERASRECSMLDRVCGGWLALFRDEMGLRLMRRLDFRELGELPLVDEWQPESWDPKTCRRIARWLLRQLDQATKDVPNPAKQRERLQQNLASAMARVEGDLVEYRPHLRLRDVDNLPEPPASPDPHWSYAFEELARAASRQILQLDLGGNPLNPYSLLEKIESNIEDLKQALTEEDRRLYEEVITNNIGRIITDRIRRTRYWVQQMSTSMKGLDISSGLVFSLEWHALTAEDERELDTEDLVRLLAKDPEVLNEEHQKRLAAHFRTRISRAKTLVEDSGGTLTSHQAIKEMLDFRRWYAFQLYYRRADKPRRKLSDRDFFRFSGGEKAMAMYIPLFSATCSRYGDAAEDAPWVVSLDEAFAGVDENNIREMFDLMERLGFNYLINSQALWGDYETVANLRICELVRPRDAPFVTVVRYRWNGKRRIRESAIEPLEEQQPLLI
ncbi:TIGR02680 family protein [Sulfidibacter corallicola]|uniref:TIGR02680 family protein n=1 Tax=Sulfidibacter corallicola TaxID=2818388 RepID=A0A8A4TW53_SULCO|nr:TIGR02680 family protein [Sulfidibacter corallicola]QTD53401.1 TIGR02680 family protein [Sulfidibacter corallicola]